MRTRFKSLLSFSLILLLAFSLAACSSSKNADSSSSPAATAAATAAPTPDATTAPTVAPKVVKEISLVMFKDWYKEGMQAVVKDIDAHSADLGFKLNVEQIVGGGDGGNLIKTRFAAKEYPMLLAAYGAPFIKNEVTGLQDIQDLSGDWTKNYSPGVIKSPIFTQDGKVYGIPFGSINIMGVFYNKKVFEKLGIQVPVTYQQFLDACAKIKAAGIVPLFASWKDGWTTNMFENEAWMRSGMTNDELFNKIETKQMKYADLGFMKDTFVKQKELIDKGYIQKTYLSDGYDDSQKAIANGTAAMTINATWIMGEIKTKFPDKVNDIGSFRVPFDEEKQASMFMPFSMMATAGFKDQDLLKKFVDYFSSPATQQLYFSAQAGIPAINGVTSDLLPGQADMKKIAIDDGNGVGFWADSKKYDNGDWPATMIDYFRGKATPEAILKTMDDALAKDAKAKNDPLFK